MCYQYATECLEWMREMITTLSGTTACNVEYTIAANLYSVVRRHSKHSQPFTSKPLGEFTLPVLNTAKQEDNFKDGSSAVVKLFLS